MDEELRRLRNTAWTEAGYLYWQRGDPDSVKREIWAQHKRTRLDETLREVLGLFGEPEPVPEAWAVREVRK